MNGPCKGKREQGLPFTQACKIASEAWRASHDGGAPPWIPSKDPKDPKAKGSKGARAAERAAERAASEAEKTEKGERAAGGPAERRRVVSAGEEEIGLICRECGSSFGFPVGEQLFYEERGCAVVKQRHSK